MVGVTYPLSTCRAQDVRSVRHSSVSASIVPTLILPRSGKPHRSVLDRIVTRGMRNHHLSVLCLLSVTDPQQNHRRLLILPLTFSLCQGDIQEKDDNLLSCPFRLRCVSKQKRTSSSHLIAPSVLITAHHSLKQSF